MNINKIDINNGFKIVEASAGTGKSFTISHIAIRNIIEKKLNPEEILILSFTKNTCRELRAKIIERINELDNYLRIRNNQKIDDTLANWIDKFIGLDSEKINIVLNHIESFNENINKLTVTTFHGLCNKLINENSIELGLFQGYKIENNLDDLYKEIINNLWVEYYLSMDVEIIDIIRNKKITTKYNLNKINEKLFIKIIKEIDQENIFQYIEHKESIDNNISEFIKEYAFNSWNDFCIEWKESGKELYNFLINFGKIIKEKGLKSTLYSSNPRKKYEMINQWIDEINKKINLNGFESSLSEIVKEDLLSNYFYIKSINKECKRLGIEEIKDEFSDLQEKIYKIKDGIFNQFIRIFTSKIYDKLSILKEKKGVLNYSDLIKIIQKSFLDKTRKNQTNIKKISIKLKAILIDEFQDTDNIQWNIIKKIFNKENHFLLCVGDPKQAIYKFRGGDLKTYLNAKNEAEEVYSLTDNYRSRNQLLEIINQIYKNGLEQSELHYKELTAKVIIEKSSDPKNIFEIINYSDKETNIELNTLGYIHNLMSQNKNLNIDKIAILTSYNYQCEELKKLFLKYNIPSNIVNRKNIFDTEASKILHIFIKCLINPYSIRNIKLLASSKFIQMDIDDLNNDDSTPIKEIFSRCTTWAREIRDKGFITLVNEIIVDYSKVISYEKDLKNNLFQLSEIIEIELIKENYNLNKILEWLTKELDINYRKNNCDNYLVKEYEKCDSINISTIHSSKGLEFDIVICPYIWNEGKNSKETKGPLWKDTNDNKFYINIEKSYRKVREITILEKRDLHNESERLLYVALTRAKNKLVIFNNKAHLQNKLHNKIFSKLKDLNKYISNIDLENNNYQIKGLKKEIINNYINLKPWQAPKIKTDYEVLKNKLNNKIMHRSSYSSWISGRQKHHFIDQEKDYLEDLSFVNESGENLQLNKVNNIYNKPTLLSEFPRGTNAGKCLHRIIERFSFKNIKTLERIIENELKNHNIDSCYSVLVKEAILAIIETPLGKNFKNKSLIDIPESNILKEMKYEIPISYKGKIITNKDIAECFAFDEEYDFSNEYISKIMELDIYSKGFHSGYIDCVLSDCSSKENSKWWVIDWKSNYISEESNNICIPRNYKYENLKKEMINHHYPLQSHLYLLALHRLLKWRLKNYKPEIHLGGYIYFFIRGLPKFNSVKELKIQNNIPGIYISNAPINRIKYLDNLFNNGN